MSNEEKKFWGPHEILSVEYLDFETELGSKVMRLTLKSDITPTETVSARAFDLFATAGPVDLTSHQEMRFRVLIKATLSNILEYHLYASEFEGFANKLGNSYEDALQRAANFLWTGRDESFIPGTSVMQYRSALEAESILRTIPNEETTEETDVPGSEE